MMKKIIALSLSLLMLLSICLTGCGEKTDDEAVADISEKASKSAVTLTAYLMSEEPVHKCEYCQIYDAENMIVETGYSDQRDANGNLLTNAQVAENNKQAFLQKLTAEGKEAVIKTCVDTKGQSPCTYRLISDAINKVTESKYKIRLVLYFYTEAEYYTALDKAFAQRDEAKKNNQLVGGTLSDTEEKEDETFVNELGQVEIKYPMVGDYQTDIYYIGGQQNFDQYKNAGRLAGLDGQLGDAAKVLNQYIFPELLSGIKTMGGGTTYAIPTNRAIGEYTYLLLNKQALNDTYRRTEGGGTTFETYTALSSDVCAGFLEDVERYMKDSYYPIYLGEGLTVEDVAKTNMQFFGADANGNFSDAFSVIGASSEKDAAYGSTFLELGSIFNNQQFISSLRTLKSYETKGYYYDATEDEGKKFAVGFVKGGAEVAAQYSDEYEVVVLENPTLDTETLCAHLMAVSSSSTSLMRSMQIITLLNTDEDFRNLVLYGIEGKHYKVVDTGVVKNEMGDTYQKVERLTTEYVMDENKTGNVFISLPLQPSGLNEAEILPSIRAYGIQQNQDLRLDPILGFGFNLGFKLDTTSMNTIRTFSEEMWADYLACTDFEAFLANAKEEYKSISKTVNNMLSCYHEDPITHKEAPCDGTCGTLNGAYAQWANRAGISKK